MAVIRLNNVNPSPGDVVSVPVLMRHVTEAGAFKNDTPSNVSCTAWNEQGDKNPIARGSVAHLFVAPSRFITGPTGVNWEIPDQFKLDILNTIQTIKSDGKPLTDWIDKIGNAYCLDYDNLGSYGSEVGLTNADGINIPDRFKVSRVGLTGRVDAFSWSNTTNPFYIKVANSTVSGSEWVHDGFSTSNMYTGYHKDFNSGTVSKLDVNKLKSAFDLSDVDTTSLEMYRGLGFETDSLGNDCARDILVIVDWESTQTYNVFSGWDEYNMPTTTPVPGPKAEFKIAWSTGGGMDSTRLTVTTDPDYSGTILIDVYPQATLQEFEFIPYGGGGGGGNNGRGGRPVSSSIPIRITSDGNIDYRHFLDLYDETNYNERNMFLTNFVGRIPYKLVEYEVSEGGINGTIRVSTNLQFTHFVGASFTDANVPRVYEVVSHRSMGGSPNVLLCTFRVCHLKDYFQHFGVTADNELLVERSTNAGLYDPWLQDPRILDDDVVVKKYYYGGGFPASNPDVLIVLNDNTSLVMPLGTTSDTPSGPTGLNDIHILPDSNVWGCSSFRAFLKAVRIADEAGDDAALSAFVNAVLSMIRSVYLIPAGSQSGSTDTYYFKQEKRMSPDPNDPNYETGWNLEIDLTCYVQYGFPSPRIMIDKTFTFQTVLDGEGEWNDSTPVKDWTDIESTFYMELPWYGSIDITGSQVKRMCNSGSFKVNYLISCVDGSITVAFGGSSILIGAGEIKPWKSLPTVPLPQSSRTLSYKQTAAREALAKETRGSESLFQRSASIATALITGALTKNPIATIGTAALSNIGISISNDARNKAGELGVLQAEQNITYGNVIGDGYQITFYECVLVQVKKREILNVYNTIGYPCKTLWRSVGAVNGGKYWVTFLGQIKGTTAYAQAVRGEIERDGIIYNYS